MDRPSSAIRNGATAGNQRPPPAGGGPRFLGWLSLPFLLVIWQVAATLLASRFLPGPLEVVAHVAHLARDAHLVADFGRTLGRAAMAFVAAMTLGTLLGFLLGRSRVADRLFGGWIVVGMNLPAIVIAIICYIWLGLSEFALVLAVVINKTPLVTTTVREGVRNFLAEYDELAEAFRMPLLRRLRLVLLPQLLPFLLAAARTGLSLIWKIVLVFEVLGSDGGVGFRIGIFYQFFDMKGILAYTSVFIIVVMAIEHGALRPLERSILRWRPDQR
jgi:NitT/TauT family transport system permease protein